MTNKHTDGKWFIGRYGDKIVAERLNKPVEPIICELAKIPEYTANANLIAAAPELLEVAERFKEYLDCINLEKMPLESHMHEWVSEIIKKARNENA